MLGYRKQSFARAHELLNALRSNLDDLDSLRALQQLLGREIIRTERKGRQLRSELKGVQSNGGSAGQKRAGALKSRLEKVRQVAYVWRCFGDAIAFCYMDKFALKQCFYSSHSTNPKQGSGFLSDKEGLASEIAFVEMALQQNIPAILTDVTNTVRFGDVCLMGESDPYLIEVKSSKKLDRRGKRQQRDLEHLRELFETDKVEMLRGMGPARRVAMEEAEVNYIDQLQLSIAAALKDGHSVTQPEAGLYYVVFAGGATPVSEVMKSLSFKSPWLFSLNMMKNQQAWSPYLPFTLSIEDHDQLWGFIRGDIFIVVLLDFEQLRTIAIESGTPAWLDLSNENYPLKIEIPGMEKPAQVSSHLLTRIGLEFVSPSWLVQASIESMKKVVAEVAETRLSRKPD
jgi:hypothetical protein